jgi:hypothetical protein
MAVAYGALAPRDRCGPGGGGHPAEVLGAAGLSVVGVHRFVLLGGAGLASDLVGYGGNIDELAGLGNPVGWRSGLGRYVVMSGTPSNSGNQADRARTT